MKKMMIAAGAAATMALFANAATSTSFGTGTGFETTGYAVGDPLNTGNDDNNTSEGNKFWSSTAAVNGFVDSVIAQDAENTQNETKYLAVDESAPLYRNAQVDAAALDLTTTNVYFQADVMFTASDATDSTDLVTTGDKILVWLQGTEAGATNLIITAATAAGNSTPVDYVVSDVTIDTAAWYTLRIEATAEGNEGEQYAAFTVQLCEKGGTLATLASGETTTFYSLVAGSTTGADTITCAGFKGTGAIDNLDFGMFEEEAAETCTVSVSVTDESGALLELSVAGTVVEAPYEMTAEVGSSVEILATVDDGYVVTYGGTTYEPVDSICTIAVDLTSATADSTVEVALVVTEASSSDYPSYITSEAAKAKYDTWAETYGVTDGTGYERAFLLNVAPDAAETTEFKITAISITADGKVTITPAEGNYKNGKVTIKQYSDPAATKESETGTFFKAVLESL